MAVTPCGEHVQMMTADLVPVGPEVDPPGPLRDGPLAGYTVGVTADRRADEQIELLERRGATVLYAPTIRTHPLVDEEGLATATRETLAEPLDIAVLTTALGTRGWVEAAESLGLAEALVDQLASCELYVRGAKAKGAASTLGLRVSWSAPTSTTEVRDRLLDRGVRGARIAIQLDGAGNEPVVADLEAAGATVIGVPVYRWTLPEDTAPASRLVRAIVEQRVDAVTFTTRTAVIQLFEIAESAGMADSLRTALNRSTKAVCVGPVCSREARALGVQDLIEPDRARLGSMVFEFAKRFEADRLELEVGPYRLRLQGRLVSIDGDEPVVLSERERSVLLALVTARGRVLSKTDLLSAVRGPGDHDTHLAEVVVARLRQRLGGAAGIIETVHRRGYRLAVA
jgi:uroporphyrinogen-III synthase